MIALSLKLKERIMDVVSMSVGGFRALCCEFRYCVVGNFAFWCTGRRHGDALLCPFEIMML